MEQIKEAIKKTKSVPPRPDKPENFERSVPPPSHSPRPAPTAGEEAGWSPPSVKLNPRHLERHRVVAVAMTDPSHVAFNLLRTKVLKTLTTHHWKTLAITSPTAGCGKTMIAANLAFSLARAPNCPTVLIDLDLRRPGLAATLGVKSPGSIGAYLQGQDEAENCFVRVGQNLIVGLNADIARDASELMHSGRMADLLRWVSDWLHPAIVLFDLPPMLVADDALAFLPNADASLLVVAAGKTTPAQVRECERHFEGSAGHLGVVLNKTREASEQGYYQGSA